MDSSIVRISDLIILNYEFIQETYSNDRVESTEKKLDISDSGKQMNQFMKQRQIAPPSEDFAWTFINFSNKKFEFFVKLSDRTSKQNDKSSISNSKEKSKLNPEIVNEQKEKKANPM